MQRVLGGVPIERQPWSPGTALARARRSQDRLNAAQEPSAFVRAVWQQFWLLDIELISFELSLYQLAPWNFLPCPFIPFHIFLKEGGGEKWWN